MTSSSSTRSTSLGKSTNSVLAIGRALSLGCECRTDLSPGLTFLFGPSSLTDKQRSILESYAATVGVSSTTSSNTSSSSNSKPSEKAKPAAPKGSASSSSSGSSSSRFDAPPRKEGWLEKTLGKAADWLDGGKGRAQ